MTPFYLSNLKNWMFLFFIPLIISLTPKPSEAADPQKASPMSTSNLEAQIKNAQPGDIITLKEGIYEAEKYHFVGKGTANQPIVIRAATQGKTIFKSPIKIEGEYITFEGCHFEGNGNIEMGGTGIRLTRCTMIDVQKGKWVRVRPGSSQIEIDHCKFSNKTINLTEPRSCQLLQIVVRNQGEKHHVHHNYFVDIPKGKSSNGYETLQLITENNPFDPAPGACETVIEHNLFERCNGEGEIISVKSNGNILRANTFLNSRGGLVLRHGDGNTVTECFFIGDDEPRAGGVRMQGQDQVVINNTFRSLGAYGVSMMDGTPDHLYIRTERALVAFNTFVNCNPALRIGLNHSKHPNGTPPKDCIIANNVFMFQASKISEAPSKTVDFVQNDEPENWTWQGNITDGDLGISARTGIQKGETGLKVLSNGLVIPAPASPLLGAAKGDFAAITKDARAQTRGKNKTIGSIENTSESATGGPLTPKDVGPEAK